MLKKESWALVTPYQVLTDGELLWNRQTSTIPWDFSISKLIETDLWLQRFIKGIKTDWEEHTCHLLYYEVSLAARQLTRAP